VAKPFDNVCLVLGLCRLVARAVTLFGTVLAGLALAGPAFANGPSDGLVFGPALGTALTVVFFVVVPLVALVIIALLCALPTLRHRGQRTPGGVLDQKALWFHGPLDVQGALSGAQPGETARGGASADW
jgi:hypothetical protein